MDFAYGKLWELPGCSLAGVVGEVVQKADDVQRSIGRCWRTHESFACD
jgi:hypothetical protein